MEKQQSNTHKSPNSKSNTIGSSLIPIVNNLQEILAPLNNDPSKIQITLPQIAVVGSQSSGKSSVLEALVGRDFLPRGCDICTRRPLVLMLENHGGDDGAEWGEFRHLPGKKFFDFAKIRLEIQSETEREAGLNKGVSDKHICLMISSPSVLNMTLIDLPGITKVPVEDQPSDIEARIRKMIMFYIKQESCIILAVSPANSDLANSDALQMAKEADPTGSRTIGVITKLDIMDRGTNASNFLLGKVIPLSLGYIGVVNRSQEDINKNRSIKEALEYEEEFFRDHLVYHGLLDRCGIPQLAKSLNQILEQHIRIALPGLKAELNCYMVAVVKELKTYGEVIESKDDHGACLLKILTKYCEAFSALVDGKSQMSSYSTKELLGGARIHYIFQSIFVKSLEKVDPCDDLTDEDIAMAIQNATGPRNTLFVPEVAFEFLVKRQIGRLLDPSLQCLRFVYDELTKMSHISEGIGIQRYPALRSRLGEVMGTFLHGGLKPAEMMIESIIDMEMGYINSSHPNFIGGNKAVELARQEIRLLLEGVEGERLPTSEWRPIARASLPKSVVNGMSLNQEIHLLQNKDRPLAAGNSSVRSWGISSIFGSRASSGDNSCTKPIRETVHNMEQIPSTIQLREPPSIIRPLEINEQEKVEILVTRLLLRSYFDIVRKNVQDLVPKAIMHFLVNYSKRDLLATFIQKLYREDLFEDLLQEQNEIATKRKRTREIFYVLQQAVQTFEDFESDVLSRCSNSNPAVGNTAAFPQIPNLSPHLYLTTSPQNRSTSKKYKTRRSAHSGEQPLPAK